MLKSNHVWIETENGKIYEWFSGNNSDMVNHYIITDEIILNKKR